MFNCLREERFYCWRCKALCCPLPPQLHTATTTYMRADSEWRGAARKNALGGRRREALRQQPVAEVPVWYLGQLASLPQAHHVRPQHHLSSTAERALCAAPRWGRPGGAVVECTGFPSHPRNTVKQARTVWRFTTRLFASTTNGRRERAGAACAADALWPCRGGARSLRRCTLAQQPLWERLPVSSACTSCWASHWSHRTFKRTVSLPCRAQCTEAAT